MSLFPFRRDNAVKLPVEPKGPPRSDPSSRNRLSVQTPRKVHNCYSLGWQKKSDCFFFFQSKKQQHVTIIGSSAQHWNWNWRGCEDWRSSTRKGSLKRTWNPNHHSFSALSHPLRLYYYFLEEVFLFIFPFSLQRCKSQKSCRVNLTCWRRIYTIGNGPTTTATTTTTTGLDLCPHAPPSSTPVPVPVDADECHQGCSIQARPDSDDNDGVFAVGDEAGWESTGSILFSPSQLHSFLAGRLSNNPHWKNWSDVQGGFRRCCCAWGTVHTTFCFQLLYSTVQWTESDHSAHESMAIIYRSPTRET